MRANELAFIALYDQLTADFGPEAFDLWIDRQGPEVQYCVRAVDAGVISAVQDSTRHSGLQIDILVEEPTSALAASTLSALTDEELQAAVGYDMQGAYYDSATSTFVALVDSADVESFAYQGARSSEAPLTLPLPVGSDATSEWRIEFVDGATIPTASIYGGVMIKNAGGTARCTAGFPATRNGVKGYYTAAHCFDYGSTWNWWTNTSGSGASAGSSTYQAMSTRTNADIMFMGVTNQSTHTMSGRFFGSSSSSTTLMSTPLSSVDGGSQCKRGGTTGYLCGYITSASFKPSSNICGGSTCNATFVLTNSLAAGGDSGGPVFNGAQPMGIVTGTSGSGNLMFYSKYGYRP